MYEEGCRKRASKREGLVVRGVAHRARNARLLARTSKC